MRSASLWLVVFAVASGLVLRYVHDNVSTIFAVVLAIVAGAIMGMWNTEGER